MARRQRCVKAMQGLQGRAWLGLTLVAVLLPCAALGLFIAKADVFIAAEDAAHGGIHTSDVYIEGIAFRLLSILSFFATIPAFNAITAQFGSRHESAGHGGSNRRHKAGNDHVGVTGEEYQAQSVAGVDRHKLWHSIQFAVLLVIFVSPLSYNLYFIAVDVETFGEDWFAKSLTVLQMVSSLVFQCRATLALQTFGQQHLQPPQGAFSTKFKVALVYLIAFVLQRVLVFASFPALSTERFAELYHTLTPNVAAWMLSIVRPLSTVFLWRILVDLFTVFEACVALHHRIVTARQLSNDADLIGSTIADIDVSAVCFTAPGFVSTSEDAAGGVATAASDTDSADGGLDDTESAAVQSGWQLVDIVSARQALAQDDNARTPQDVTLDLRPPQGASIELTQQDVKTEPAQPMPIQQNPSITAPPSHDTGSAEDAKPTPSDSADLGEVIVPALKQQDGSSSSSSSGHAILSSDSGGHAMVSTGAGSDDVVVSSLPGAGIASAPVTHRRPAPRLSSPRFAKRTSSRRVRLASPLRKLSSFQAGVGAMVGVFIVGWLMALEMFDENKEDDRCIVVTIQLLTIVAASVACAVNLYRERRHWHFRVTTANVVLLVSALFSALTHVLDLFRNLPRCPTIIVATIVWIVAQTAVVFNRRAWPPLLAFLLFLNLGWTFSTMLLEAHHMEQAVTQGHELNVELFQVCVFWLTLEYHVAVTEIVLERLLLPILSSFILTLLQQTRHTAAVAAATTPYAPPHVAHAAKNV